MIDVVFAVVFVAALLIGAVGAIVRFVSRLRSIGSASSSSSLSRPASSFGVGSGLPGETSEYSRLAELSRRQSELRIDQARQMLIDAGINPNP